MRVTLLGTGGSAGVPLIGGPDGAGDWGRCDPAEPRNRRSRASILIEGPEGALLVDTAPDLRAQLLACRVRRVDGILFTHAHADPMRSGPGSRPGSIAPCWSRIRLLPDRR